MLVREQLGFTLLCGIALWRRAGNWHWLAASSTQPAKPALSRAPSFFWPSFNLQQHHTRKRQPASRPPPLSSSRHLRREFSSYRNKQPSPGICAHQSSVGHPATMASTGARTGERVVHQDYIARIRFSNALPPPPTPPKLLDIPNTGLASGQYTTPGFASRLAREQPLNIEADAELGMPLNLVGMPGVFDGDERCQSTPITHTLTGGRPY